MTPTLPKSSHKLRLHCMLRKSSRIIFFYFPKWSPARMPEHQTVTLKQTEKSNPFPKNNKIYKTNNDYLCFVGFSILRIPFIQPQDTVLTMVFGYTACVWGSARGLLEGPRLDSDNFIIWGSSRNGRAGWTKPNSLTHRRRPYKSIR